MKPRLILQACITTVILCGSVWYVSTIIDVGNTIAIIRQSNLLLVVLTMPLVLLSHVVRAWRWQLLLQPAVGSTSLVSAFNAVMIGYAANSILPRSGEIIRPTVLAIRSRFSVSTSLSSVLIERVVDVVSLLLALVLVLWVAPSIIARAMPGVELSGAALRIALPLVCACIAAIVFTFSKMGMRFIVAVARTLKNSAAPSVESTLVSIRSGMLSVQKPRLWAPIFFATISIWLLYAAPLYVMLHALPSTASLSPSFGSACIILVVVAFGVTIAPTPAALGVYQTFAQSAFVATLGGSADEGFAFGMLSWIVNYGLAFLVGLLCWLAEHKQGLTLSSLRAAQEPQAP